MEVREMTVCLWCGEVKSIEHSHKQFWGEYNEIRLQLTMLCLACNNTWFKLDAIGVNQSQGGQQDEHF
jgi:hypothetical protein